jgi:hypothetical protein
MSVTSQETQVRIISALTEGCSIRATECLTGAHRDTVMRLSVRVGEGCERLHDRLMRDLQVATIECDEQWDYIAKKQKRVKQGDPAEFGDVWLHVAMSATHKAVISYVVGKRDAENTEELAIDLRTRILNRPQITSDGYAPSMSARSARHLALTSILPRSPRNTSAIPICRTRRTATRPVTSLASKRP